jgi:hypothetical protein
MNYFSLPLCKLLHSKGVMSESDHWWISNRGIKPEVWDMTMVSDYDSGGMVKLCDAYGIADILRKEALIILFPEVYGSQIRWKVELQEISILYAEQGLEAVENYLLKELEE